MTFEQIKKSLFVSLWFMVLTFPIMVIRVNTIHNTVEWRWHRMFLVGIGVFFFSFLWRYLMKKKEVGLKRKERGESDIFDRSRQFLREPRFTRPAMVVLGVFVIAFPFLFSLYQTNIMVTALIYVVTGLGLNIVVGLAGLLDLGYVAFYAVGAYSYALLHYHFGVGFWLALPIGGGIGMLFGILLGFPVLRLRGDYLAIVTLGFGEIIRLILENWNAFSFGPSGIANIPRPGLFGIDFSLHEATTYIYFLMVALALLQMVLVTALLQDIFVRQLPLVTLC